MGQRQSSEMGESSPDDVAKPDVSSERGIQ